MLIVSCFDWLLRGVGASALCGAVLGVVKLRRLKKNCCDASTASAVLPPDAFAGKVVWITGASSGIGKELAVQLARQGAKLILSSRQKAALDGLAAELKKSLATTKEGDVRVLPLDLNELDTLEQKAKEALTFFGTVDVLVNNGGYSSRAVARDTTGVQGEVQMMRVNFLSYVALAKALMPHWRERRGGHVVNISSFAGKFGAPMRTLYCGAKHALMGWFDALRVEEVGVFNSGLTVTNICPGSVKTDVAVNAVTADGSKRGYSDPGIENGLDVAFTCDRILAATHCRLDEAWIAPPNEMQAVYMSQYLPATFKVKLQSMAPQLVARTMGDDWVASKL